MRHMKRVTLSILFTVLVSSATMIAYATTKTTTVVADTVMTAATTPSVNPELAMIAAAMVLVVAVIIYSVRHRIGRL